MSPFDKFFTPNKKEKKKQRLVRLHLVHTLRCYDTHYADKSFAWKKGLLKKYSKEVVVVAPSGWVKKRVFFNIETLRISCCVWWGELLLGYTSSIPICLVFVSCCNCVAKQFQFLWGGDWNFYMVWVCMCQVLSLLFILQFLIPLGSLLNGWWFNTMLSYTTFMHGRWSSHLFLFGIIHCMVTHKGET